MPDNRRPPQQAPMTVLPENSEDYEQLALRELEASNAAVGAPVQALSVGRAQVYATLALARATAELAEDVEIDDREDEEDIEDQEDRE